MDFRRTRSSLVALLVAIAAAYVVPAVAQASAPSIPWVTISPLKGTPDASPTTQISFLGVPASELSKISVRGSRSGGHGGKLVPYAAGAGVSFVPARGFTVGETVTVTATETFQGHAKAIGTTFTIGTFSALPPPGPRPSAPTTPPPAGTVLSYASQPTLRPPSVAVTIPAADPTLGDVFLTPVDGRSQSGPMIVSPSGALVWFAPAPPGSQAADLRVQQYLGAPVLTYWQGRVVLGHGAGVGVIENTSYRQIAQVRAGNGLQMDLHEFDLEPNGVAFVTVYQPVHWNLSSVHGPANGIIEDCIVQEIDVRTGLVMFEWHALGHVPMSASYSTPQPLTTAVWDWFHINSINVEPNGNLLISSRNTWAVYQIGHTFGEVLWTLGGRNSTFKLGPNVRFAWQHDASLLPDGSVQIFDNEDTPKIGGQSRGIDIGLNFKTLTATLLHQYVDPQQSVLSASQGDVQQLGNTDQLVGWGQIGLVSELSAAGALTFQLKFPALVQSYRAYRFPWTATPQTPPSAVAGRLSSATVTSLSASWNGATGVVAWQVIAGLSASSLAPVGGPTASAGFETALTAPTTAPYVAVEALGPGGALLGTSSAIAVTPTPG